MNVLLLSMPDSFEQAAAGQAGADPVSWRS
jgi:hypothetical protein